MEKLTSEQVEVRRRWTEALRSGEYPQGKRLLNNDGRLCCLGVLCEVSGASKTCNKYGRVAYDGFWAMLPPRFQFAAGLGSEKGRLLPSDSVSLVHLNDGNDFTFDEIADVIDLDTLMRQDGAL